MVESMLMNFEILILQTMKVSKWANWAGKDGSLCVVAQRAPQNSQWLVLRNGGAYFLHSRFVDSI